MSQLTPEEEALLSQQSDPDISSEAQYQWSVEYQRKILGMLLNDRTFLLQSQGLILPNYFQHEVHQLVCKILYGHFDKYKQRPNRTYLVQEVEEQIRDKPAEVKVYFRGELNTVYDNYIPNIEDRDYLRDKITDFAKEQAMKVAIFKCMEILKRQEDEKWPKIYNLVESAMRVERNFEMGEDYFVTFEERYARVMKARETGDVFTTGVPSFDHALMGGGLLRGEIGAWTGVSGTGKSLCLTGAAVANLKRGKKVLVVTLEMDQDRTSERFDAQFADPGRLHGVGINNLYDKKEIVFQGLRDFVSEHGEDDPRMLVIKHFPSGSMDVPTFRAFYAQVQLYGFQPDLVIVDYVGEMKDYPGVPVWQSRQMIVRDLRGFAAEEKVCMLIALQPDKKAKDLVRQGLLIDDDNLADSYGQIRPLDAFWSINQSAAEKDAGLARAKAVKHRAGESGFVIYLDFDKQQLKFSEINKDEYEKRKKNVDIHRDLTAQDMAYKDMRGSGKKKKKDPIVVAGEQAAGLAADGEAVMNLLSHPEDQELLSQQSVIEDDKPADFPGSGN
jgi:hypothetical protein